MELPALTMTNFLNKVFCFRAVLVDFCKFIMYNLFCNIFWLLKLHKFYNNLSQMGGKEGVAHTYKGFDGYAPMMAYIGTEGFLVNTELRKGNQHCQCNTPAFIRQTLRLGHQLADRQLLVRMDAGNDAAENLGILIEDGSWFIVKRNLRRGESKEDWIAKVKECCKDIRSPRDGKTVYIGSSWKDIAYTDSEGESKTITMRIV